ncbi:MAG: phosphatase [Eubacteriales bacterium]
MRGIKLVADLHTHSVGSGHAYSTITEIAEAARAIGLAVVAITDHGPAMPGGPHLYYFGNLRVLPAEIAGVRVLKGVEANIISENGQLDLDKFYLERLDVVLAGFHAQCFPSADRETCTRAMLNALDNPYVDIIVHPGNPEFPVDFEVVIKKAAEKGLPLEINNSSFCGSRRGSDGNCHEIARMIAHYGAAVVIDSDAHFARDVGKFDKAIETALAEGIKEEQVLNTSVEKVLNYLGRKKELLHSPNYT